MILNLGMSLLNDVHMGYLYRIHAEYFKITYNTI